jgi:hypothetical protein
MAARAFFLAVANFFALFISSQLALLTSDSIGILLVISNNMLAFYHKRSRIVNLPRFLGIGHAAIHVMLAIWASEA